MFTKPITYCLLFSLLTIGSCVAQKKTKGPKPTLISATSQNYSGGMKGSSRGVKYRIQLVAPANQDEFKVQGFWVENAYAIASAHRDKLGVNKALYEKGDTITVSANFTIDKDKIYQEGAAVNLSKPAGYNSKGLVQFTNKSKKVNYFEINQFEKLPEELRP